MFDVLRAYFERTISLTEDQFAYVRTQFQPKHLKKGQFLLREGEIATHGAFVAQGCLRSYAIDQKGKEHILQFAPENWWISNLDSLTNKTPSIYFIDAIEDSGIFIIDQPSFRNLMVQLPAFAALFQEGVQKHSTTRERRIIGALSATAEERYNDFLNTYPSIALRIPQHMLASFLGITPETLSRIRKLQSRKK